MKGTEKKVPMNTHTVVEWLKERRRFALLMAVDDSITPTVRDTWKEDARYYDAAIMLILEGEHEGH